MTLDQIRRGPIAAALSLLPDRMTSPEAEVMLLAIGLQESRFEHRHQIGGPAHGWWQFEMGGGVRGVLTHPASRDLAKGLCAARGVAPTSMAAFAALERDDILAAGFARLLLWTDPRPLPRIGEVQAAWDYYIRNWRPGKPHPKTWAPLYAQAMEEVGHAE